MYPAGKMCPSSQVSCIPWSTHRTLASFGCGNGGVCGVDGGVGDVDAVFVGECGVGSFPGDDSAAAATECHVGVLNPSSAKACVRESTLITTLTRNFRNSP